MKSGEMKFLNLAQSLEHLTVNQGVTGSMIQPHPADVRGVTKRVIRNGGSFLLLLSTKLALVQEVVIASLEMREGFS